MDVLMPDAEEQKKVAVVGAGLAGLVCAAALARSGVDVTVFDKGRFPGGRLASRRRDQYFTARDISFRNFLSPLVRQKKVQKWQGKFARSNGGILEADLLRHPRYVGVPLMRALAEHLSSSLQCLMSHKVSEVAKKNGKWLVRGTKEGESEKLFASENYDYLVLNMPPAQAAALHPHPQLDKAGLLPCIALLLAFEKEVPIRFDGIILDDPLLSWAARDSSKPGRGNGERWMLHASAAWSCEHMEDNAELLASSITARFSAAFNVDLPEIIFSKVHKWKYALPNMLLESGCIIDEQAAVIYCGDWCQAPRVEGAFLSGTAAAEEILRLANSSR